MQKKLFLTIIFMVVLYLPLSAQQHGKLFSRAEVDRLYGPVIESVKVPKGLLLNLAKKTPEVILFKIVNKKAIVLGKKREFLYSTGLASFTNNDKFSMYSTSNVLELLNEDAGDEVMVEQRESVMSVTYGSRTLELATICPPHCGW